MGTQDRIYCLILFPTSGKAFYLNRAYEFIGDDKKIWGKIELGQIVESSRTFFPTFEYQYPKWAKELHDKQVPHIALWLY